MPTYLEIQQRVTLDCLNRIDLIPEAKRAIQSMIRKYEKQRWWFNETSTAINATANQAYISVPADLLAPQELRVSLNNDRCQLRDLSYEDLQDQNDSSATGRPVWYCHFGEQFQLAPIPDSAYPITVTYLQKLSTLSADSDTNSFLSAMEDCIVFGAASIVAANLGNVDVAVKYKMLETEFYKMAVSHRDQRIIKRIRPTKF